MGVRTRDAGDLGLGLAALPTDYRRRCVLGPWGPSQLRSSLILLQSREQCQPCGGVISRALGTVQSSLPNARPTANPTIFRRLWGAGAFP